MKLTGGEPLLHPEIKDMHQMERLVRMAESLKVSSVKFNVVQPMARGKSITTQGRCLRGGGDLS